MGSFTGSLLQVVLFRCHKFVFIFIVLMLNCCSWALARAALRVGVKKALISFSIDARNALFIRVLCCFCDALLGTNLERL